MFKFFRKSTRVEVIRRSETKLRLSEWQGDAELCLMASKVLANPDLQLMLSVMKNEHPLRTALPYGVSLNDRAVLQARAEGYEMFLSNLERMAISTRLEEPPEATFGTE